MTFDFREGQESQAFPLLFDPFLFNEPRHLAVQRQPGDQLLTFTLHVPEGILVRLSVFITEERAVSPRRATFGGIEAAAGIAPEILIAFVQRVTDRLKDLSTVVITQYPEALAPETSPLIREALLAAGFQLTNTDLNYHIPVTDAPFEDGLHRGERWKARKAERMGFAFRKIERADPEILQDFVIRARERKGHRITLFPGLFAGLFQHFPEDIYAFGVFDGEHMIAVAVTIRLNSNALYTFHLADDGDYSRYSPTVFLIRGVYDWCRANGFGLLDLGIATDRGERNEGLIRFKKNLGATESEKGTFTYPFEKSK